MKPPRAESEQPYGQVVAILAVVLSLAYVDRQLLVVLIEPIRKELGLSDTQIGIMTGAAFALVYGTLGMPLARLADRTSRRGVLVGAVVVWSLMTCVCGLAQNVWQMILARMGVGAGEAGCIPPAHSLIASITPAPRLSFAMSVYSIGVPAGVLIGMVVGGWLGEWLGWRMAFLVAGLPGVLVALLVRFGIREPASSAQLKAVKQPPIWVAAKVTLRGPMPLVLIGSGLISLSVGALLVWTPSLLARSTALGVGAIGAWLGLVIGVSGAAGMLFGGVIGDRLGKVGPRWRLMTAAGAGLLAAAASVGMLHQTTASGTLIFLVLPILLGMSPTGVTNAVIQSLAPESLRAFSASLLIFANTAFGIALGPLVVGVISDALNVDADGQSLKAALVVVPSCFLAGGLCHMAAALKLKSSSPAISSAAHPVQVSGP